jgi:hypothetical protein
MSISSTPFWKPRDYLLSGAKMSLADWANNGWLRPHKSSAQEIADLLAIVERDLADAGGKDSPYESNHSKTGMGLGDHLRRKRHRKSLVANQHPRPCRGPLFQKPEPKRVRRIQKALTASLAQRIACV